MYGFIKFVYLQNVIIVTTLPFEVSYLEAKWQMMMEWLLAKQENSVNGKELTIVF